MRLVATRRLKAGAVLAKDVTYGVASERALLRAGVPITERYRQALLDGGHNAVYVEDELSHGIVATPAIGEKTRREATQALHSAFGAMREGGTPLPHQMIGELEHVAQIVAGEIAESTQAAVAFSDLAAADAYTLQHSIDVCVLGLLMAKHSFERHGRLDYRGVRVYDKRDQWLAKLGMGLLLADVGMVAVPAEIVAKPGPLTPEEAEEMRRHPEVGVELVASSLISPLVTAVVRHHHERWDGSGYPAGLAGAKIPQFARIAAVADVFDAVTSERHHRESYRQHVGCEVVNQGRGTQFDPEVVDIFNAVVAPWPPGDEIQLADGRCGVVVSCPEHALDRPLVRVGFDPQGNEIPQEEIDLRSRDDLLPVRPYEVPAADAPAA